MKTRLFMLLCLGILLAACKKHTVNPNNALIRGTWELRATRGGNILPATYPPGNGHLLGFDNATFTEYTSGMVVAQGTYIRNIHNAYQFTISSNYNNVTFTEEVTIQNDTLKLMPGNPDVATSLYVKINDELIPVTN